MGTEKAYPNTNDKVEAIMRSDKISPSLKDAVRQIKLKPMKDVPLNNKASYPGHIPPYWCYQKAQALEFAVNGVLYVIRNQQDNLHHVVVPNGLTYKPLKGIFIETSLSTGPLCHTGISGVFALAQMDGVDYLGFNNVRTVLSRKARYSQFVKTKGGRKVWSAGPENVHTLDFLYLY